MLLYIYSVPLLKALQCIYHCCNANYYEWLILLCLLSKVCTQAPNAYILNFH